MVARRFDSTLEKELVQLHEGGMTQMALAERYDTTLATVRRALRRAGVQTRGQGANKRNFSDEEVAQIVSLYESGDSQEQIARKLRTTQPKISIVLSREGLYSGRGAKHGQRHPRWKGGRVRTPYGYIAVKPDQNDEIGRQMAMAGFYVLEHRLVMAHSLGRPLTKEETVHHINGAKDDNRLENLQLRSGRHGNGKVLRCRTCGSHDIESVTIT